MTNYLAVDTETNGFRAALDPDVELWMITVADDTGSREVSLDELQVIVDSGVKLVFHNSSFDLAVLRLRGLRISPGQYEDTIILSHVIQPRRAHGLEAWGEELGYSKLDFHDFSRRTDEMLVYGLRDTELTWKLWKHLRKLSRPSHWSFYYSIALPYVESIIEMQTAGIQLDMDTLTELESKLTQDAERLLSSLILLHPYTEGETKLYKSGYLKRNGVITWNHCQLKPFNPASGDQVAEVLQTRYGWEPEVFSEKTGKPLTAASILDEIAIPEAADFLRLLSQYNNTKKMLSTFIGKWASVQEDGLIFPGLNQTGTITGRLSSSGESGNFQNIPARGEHGAVIRSIITHPDGYNLFGGDMSNLEGRVLASVLYQYTGDDTLVRVFQRGEDFHTSNARSWGLVELVGHFIKTEPLEVVEKYARTLAKTALYAVLYGAGAAKIAAGASRGMPVRMSKSDGELVMATMRESMPSIFQAKEMFWDDVRSNDGQMFTLLGRPLYYPDIIGRDKSLRARAERQSFNALLQGTAADIMQDLQNKTKRVVHEAGAWFILQVHDELLGYAPPDTSEYVTQYLTSEFSNAQYLSPVPLVANFQVGETWNHIH